MILFSKALTDEYRTAVISIVRLKTLIPTLHAVDQTWAIAYPGNWM